MSVLMTLRAKGDPVKLEKMAANDPGMIRAISDDAKKFGCIAHRFYGSDDGQILVLDEWPDAESFHRFFDAHQGDIGPMMAEIGATAPPEITFYRALDTHDEVGWGS
jgi:hypothetical protein